MHNIGERIQQLRKNQNLTQVEFGKIFGVTHAHISSIERGKENPSEMFILFIIEKLGVNETWLRTGIGEMYVISNFDTRTDAGNITKFELLNKNLIEYLNTISGDELRIVIKILSYFQSSLIVQNFSDKDKKIDYLEYYEKIIKTLDNIFANANSLTCFKENSKSSMYEMLLSFSSEANKNISQINATIKEILNLYVDTFLSNEKLGFKVF